MLGLRKKVCRDPTDVDGTVCENCDFARSRNLVYRHISVHLALCGRYERIAGTGDLLHLLASLRAERHHADGLYAADAVNLSCARELERIKKHRIHFSRRARRSACDDFLNARGLGERHRHYGSRGERSRSAWDIDADAVHRRVELAQGAAARRLHRPGVAQRRLGKLEHAAVRVLHGADCFRVDALLGNF